MGKRKHPEYDLQCAVVEHLRLRGVEGLRFWHTPNGGFRNVREAARFKKMGVLPGVADLILVRDGSNYALELKVGRRPLSQSQTELLRFLRANGWLVWVASGIDEALRALECWGLIR